MSGPDRPVTPLAASVEVLRRQMGLGRPSLVARVESELAQLVGEAAAARSTVVGIRNGVMTLEAVDPPTAEALRLARGRILGAVAAAGGRPEVSSIEVRVRRR